MPKHTLSADWKRFTSESTRLRALVDSLSELSVSHRKLIGEIVMVRLFLLSENTVASVCSKLLCGACYLDGTTPRVMRRAVSMADARNLMKVHGRQKPKGQLMWARAREIADNVKNTLNPGDPLFIVLRNHGAVMAEMRYVRNHIVHKNNGTRRNFRNVVRSHYGGLRRGVTPGVLLLTDAFGGTTLMERYLAYYRILIRELLRA